MDNPMNQPVIAPERELGAELLQWIWGLLQRVGLILRGGGVYLMDWPFMCHAGLVLAGAWIASYLHLSVALVCSLGFLYLFQIERRQRERLTRSIGYDERKKARKSRMPEGESVRWMNEVMEKVWPIFLEDFASQMLLVPMNSFMDRFCKPWTVKKLLLQNLSIGKTPPTVTMVRVLDEAAEGDDLAVEASLEWNAAKDMAAVLAVQVRRRLGLGMWTNVHLCNLEVEGKVKVGIKFRDGWPLIERIRICFAKAPHMDMKCHPLYNSGVDVSELPGIASYLDRLVADALAQSLVEPNQMEIDMVKLMKDVTRPVMSPKGDWFAFRGNPPAADVAVQILEATNLRVGDLNGYSDPYVRVTFNGTQHRETKVIRKTLNPKWNETFAFSISSWEDPNTMILQVRDKDHIFDDQLGYQIVELSRFRDGKAHDIWLPLLQVDTGKIHLLITIDERQTDSQSSEDVSTTLEKATGQIIPPESDGNTLSQRLPSPRQRLKANKSGKALDSEENSSKKVGRQRSGFFTSRSSRRASERETKPERQSPPTDTTTDEATITVLDVGFGEHGAVKICQAGDAQPTPWPEERGAEVKGEEGGHIQALDEALLERECLANVDEDGHAARKLQSAGLSIPGRFHRVRKGRDKDSDATSPRQDLHTRRRFHTNATASGVLNDEDASGAAASGDPERQHLGSKAKGVLVKAAGQVGHQISKTMNRRRRNEKEGVVSSEEVTTSGEFTPMAESGPVEPVNEVPTTTAAATTTTDLLQQQQHGLPLPRKQPTSVPPSRPPPGLPPQNNLQAEIHGSPIYDDDVLEVEERSKEVNGTCVASL